MKFEDVQLTGSLNITGSFNVPFHTDYPNSPTEGDLFYHTVSGSLFVRNDDEWILVPFSGSSAAAEEESPAAPAQADIEYLVVAGGGAAGRRSSSGTYYQGAGGAGGLLSSSLSSIESGSSITVIVGAGGAAYAGASTFGNGSNGGNSSIASSTGTSFTTVTSIGGGRGSTIDHPSSDAAVTNQDGADGGSGGGATGWNNTAGTGGSGTTGQGFYGGSGVAGGDAAGAGGGGAGGAGTSNSGTAGKDGGTGGPGLQSSITGTSTYYAAGAGGGKGYAGGDGAEGVNGTGYTGNSNTGDGGQPGIPTRQSGKTTAGNSGVVILRYPSSSIGAFGGTELKSNSGERIHKFTSSGTLVVGSSTTTPPLDNHYPSTVTKPSIFINPRAIGTDGTFDTIPDYGSVGRDFHNAGGSNNTKINTAGGSYDALDTVYGSGARGFAAGSTSLGTTYSDYNTNQHHSYNCFFRYDPSMQSDTNYPLLWIVKPNTANSSTSYYGAIQIGVWRGGLTQTGKIYVGLYNVSGGSNVHGATQTSTVTSGDTWYMCTVVVTYGSSGNIKIYLNGSLNVTSSTADNTGTGGSSSYVGLGESYATIAGYNYGGMTFGVSHAWFGTALTATDVTNLWNFYKADYGLS